VRSGWRLAKAYVLRDFRVERSYRLAFVSSLFGSLTTLLSSGFLSRLVPDDQPALDQFGSDYFTFVLIGTASLSFFTLALGTFSGNLDTEQRQGTLEALLVSPRDPRLLLVCGSLYPFLFATGQMLVYLAGGVVLFSADLPLDRMGLAALMTLLTIGVFGSIGMAAASVVIITKRAGSLLTLTAAVFALFGGVLYPIDVLPSGLRIIARVLPMAYGLEGVRLSLVDDLDVGTIARDAGVLVASMAILIPFALTLFKWGVDRARRTGSLAQY
jgi:ABC-2 type transport system permease protein